MCKLLIRPLTQANTLTDTQATASSQSPWQQIQAQQGEAHLLPQTRPSSEGISPEPTLGTLAADQCSPIQPLSPLEDTHGRDDLLCMANIPLEVMVQGCDFDLAGGLGPAHDLIQNILIEEIGNATFSGNIGSIGRIDEVTATAPMDLSVPNLTELSVSAERLQMGTLNLSGPTPATDKPSSDGARGLKAQQPREQEATTAANAQLNFGDTTIQTVTIEGAALGDLAMKLDEAQFRDLLAAISPSSDETGTTYEDPDPVCLWEWVPDFPCETIKSMGELEPISKALLILIGSGYALSQSGLMKRLKDDLAGPFKALKEDIEKAFAPVSGALKIASNAEFRDEYINALRRGGAPIDEIDDISAGLVPSSRYQGLRLGLIAVAVFAGLVQALALFGKSTYLEEFELTGSGLFWSSLIFAALFACVAGIFWWYFEKSRTLRDFMHSLRASTRYDGQGSAPAVRSVVLAYIDDQARKI